MRRQNLLKLCALALALLCALPLCSGCLGATQIEEYGYVQSFGIAKGEHKKYEYSFLLQYYAAAGEGSSGSGESGGVMIGAEGDTLFEAIALATAGLPYELNFSRTASVFISEELAKEEGIEQLFALSFSALKLRYSIKLLIVNGDPRVFQEGLQVKNSPDLLQMQRSVLYSHEWEGTVPNMNYAMFYEAVTTGRFDPAVQYGAVDMNILQSGSGGNGESGGASGGSSGGQDEQKGMISGVNRYGGMAAYAEGAALFDGMRMVGTLNGEETKFMLMGQGTLGRTFINYTRPSGQLLSVQVARSRKPEVKLKLGETPQLHMRIPLVCEFYMDNEDTANRQWQKGLKRELEVYMQDAVRGVFISCRDMGCDAFALGKRASMQFKSLSAWEAYNWKEKYKNTEATFEVVLALRDSYIQLGAE